MEIIQQMLNMEEVERSLKEYQETHKKHFWGEEVENKILNILTGPKGRVVKEEG